MTSSDDDLQRLFDKHRPGIDRLKRWSDFYALNPLFCPHSGVIAAVAKDGTDLPGTCLDCGREGVTADMQGDVPDGEPFTITTQTSASTVTADASFSPAL